MDNTEKREERTINIRAAIENNAHKALKQEQSRRELETGRRPHITEVISAILTDWAAKQPVTGS